MQRSIVRLSVTTATLFAVTVPCLTGVAAIRIDESKSPFETEAEYLEKFVEAMVSSQLFRSETAEPILPRDVTLCCPRCPCSSHKRSLFCLGTPPREWSACALSVLIAASRGWQLSAFPHVRSGATLLGTDRKFLLSDLCGVTSS